MNPGQLCRSNTPYTEEEDEELEMGWHMITSYISAPAHHPVTTSNQHPLHCAGVELLHSWLGFMEYYS
jgi:hypothetical protein